MKILHIITSLELGGAERLLVDIVNLQRREGHHVDVLVLYDKENVFKLKSFVSKYNSKSSYKNIFEINRVIRKGKYNIVHTHLTHAQVWTSIASFFDLRRILKFMLSTSNKRRVYLTSEHSTYNNRRDKKYLKTIEKLLYGRYSNIICISEGVKNTLTEWLEERDLSKYSVIENGVNLENFENVTPVSRESLGLTQEDHLIAMVSRLNKAKDHETLLNAMTLLPKKYKLILVGEGPKREELEKLSLELKLGNRVKFLGVRTDIPELLKTTNIVVQSSHYEGFGLAAVEAMAAGIPLIASDVSGLGDVVRGAGILFQQGNFKELAKKILEIDGLESKDEIIAKEKERAENYSLKITADRYIDLYKELLEDKK